MKKAAFAAGLLMILFLTGCINTFNDPVMACLPDYKSKRLCETGGFQDYTDYNRYFYESVTEQAFTSSAYFKPVKEEDIINILMYIEDFENWVEVIGKELKEQYDFDKSYVAEGDFFYIKTKYGEQIDLTPPERFYSYTLYYFDMDTQTLYYFHNNI